MLLRMCSRCGQPTANTPAICDSCLARAPSRQESTRLYDANVRDKQAARFYHSADWRRSRDAYLASVNYVCQDCLTEVRQGRRAPSDVRPATDVHHVVPISVDWSRRLDPSNYCALCDAHHKARRAEKLTGGGRPKK